jgi:YgiT-type zinc finger domain-containing protein
MGRLSQEKEMKCIVCRGEDIQVTAVREELHMRDDIVYVPIHIHVCHTCGERYYDRRTVRFLEDIQQEIREKKARLQEVGKVLQYEGC